MADISDGKYFIINGASVKTGVIGTKNVYRSYNPSNGDHFFTTSYPEHWKAVHTYGYSNEGVAFQVFDVSSAGTNYVAVYRLFKTASGTGGGHLYTTNTSERTRLISQGWKDEGIAWYGMLARPAGHGAAAVYRLYCPSGSTSRCKGKHHYTVSLSEVNDCVAQGWTNEGIHFYAGGVYALDLSTSRITDYGASSLAFSNGTNIQIYTSSFSDGQIWQVKTNSDGSKKILNPKTGRMVSVAGDSSFSQGDNVHLMANSTKYPANQKWAFVNNGTAQTYQGVTYTEYRIKLFGNPGNKEWDLDVLGVDSGQTSQLEPGRNVDIAKYAAGREDRLWIFVPVPEFRPDMTTYLISPLLDTTKYLNPVGSANGSQINIARSSGKANQYWTIADLGTVTDTGQYVLYNVYHSPKVVDVSGDAASAANGKKIQMYDFDNRSNSWNITRYEDLVIDGVSYAVVKFWFTSNGKTWCLDLKGADVADGQNVQLYEDNGGDNQRWVLIPQSVATGGIPAPINLGLGTKIGDNGLYSDRHMLDRYYPFWQGSNGWLGNLTNGYEWRYRSRYMSSASSTWLSWSSWTAWTNSELSESNGYFWVTEGIPTKYNQMNYKNLQINFQVRCTSVDATTQEAIHGPAADRTVNVIFVPTYNFSSAFMTPDGLRVAYSHDYTTGQANLRLRGIDVIYADKEVSNILTKTIDLKQLGPSGYFTIPMSYLSAYPNLDAVSLRFRYYSGNDQHTVWTSMRRTGICPYAASAGTVDLGLATYPYQRHTALLRVKRLDNLYAWISKNGDSFEMTEIKSLDDGVRVTETFAVPDGTTQSSFMVSAPPLSTVSVSTPSGEVPFTLNGRTYNISPLVLGREPYNVENNTLTVRYTVMGSVVVDGETVEQEVEVEETFAVADGETPRSTFTVSNTPVSTVSLSTPLLDEIPYTLNGSTYDITPYSIGEVRPAYDTEANTLTITYMRDPGMETYAYFLVPYNWNQDSRIVAYGYSDDKTDWGFSNVVLSSDAVDNTPVHSWIVKDGTVVCIDCRPDTVLSSTAEYQAETTTVKLAGRTRDFVTVGTVVSNQFTVEGAIMYSDEFGYTDCNLEEIQDIVGTHCVYRNPHGNLLRVVVAGVSSEAFYHYATVRVSMIEESD